MAWAAWHSGHRTPSLWRALFGDDGEQGRGKGQYINTTRPCVRMYLLASGCMCVSVPSVSVCAPAQVLLLTVVQSLFQDLMCVSWFLVRTMLGQQTPSFAIVNT